MRVYGGDLALPLAIYFLLYYRARIHDNFVVFCNSGQALETGNILYRATHYTLMRLCSQA